MEGFMIQPTAMAQWDAAVSEAQFHTDIELEMEVKAYLTHLLIHFTPEIQLAKSVIALEMLKAVKQAGPRYRAMALRKVGDKCLLFSGLFPGRSKRRHVDVSYFIDIGQSAYYRWATSDQGSFSEIAALLCEQFEPLVSILQAMRFCVSSK